MSPERRVLEERVLQRTENEVTGEAVAAVRTLTGVERLETNRWTRLAAGMHYRDALGTLQPSKDEIELAGNAASATRGPLKAIWEANANQPAAQGAIKSG